MTEHTLDVSRLLCPMPVIKTQQKVKSLDSGDRLNIIATDPGALHDIPAWCRIYGHKVIETKEHAGEIQLLIEVDGG